MLFDIILLFVFAVLVFVFHLPNFYFLLFVPYFVFKYHLLQFLVVKIKDLVTYFKSVHSGTYFKRIYGIYGIVGEYGQGKTIELSRQFLKLKRKTKFHNPDNYIFVSNYGLSDTLPFKTLADVLAYYRMAVKNNKGLIVFWDEIQNEFPENDKSFPSEFRVLLTQNRKYYGVRLLWSTQDYTRVNKNLRLMTTVVTQMRCLFSRYMIASFFKRAVYEDYYETTDITRKIKKRSFFTLTYIQTDYLRSVFDSFKMLDISKQRLGISD